MKEESAAEKLEEAMQHPSVKEVEEVYRHSGQAVDRQGELPKAREGWFVKHPTSDKPIEVVTREDYDWLYKQASEALAAERQRAEQAERQLGMVVDWRDQLAATKEQLLSALAAIEKHNTDHVDDTFCCIDIDLSPLHEHDAKLTENVRKPLVDALKEIRDHIGDEWGWLRAKCEDALAQCKQLTNKQTTDYSPGRRTSNWS